MKRTFLSLFALLALSIATMASPKVFTGPYAAEVIRVVDSDTVELRVFMWPEQYVTVAVRILGVDTPEKFQPKCALEKQKALEATAFVTQLLPSGTEVGLIQVRPDKYGGRVVGDIRLSDGSTLATQLIGRKLAVPYDGGTKAENWCAVP